MLRRLGFAGRLMAIVLLALLALWVLGMGWTYVSQVPDRSRMLLPLPKQVAAIIELLEATDDSYRDMVLDAANSDTLRVTVSDKLSATAPDGRRLPAVEWLVARYVDAVGDREIVALLAEAPNAGQRGWWFGAPILSRDRPLKLAVALKTGGHAVFETRGELSRRLLGLPPGFWMGVLGSLIGIAAIVAVAREARPLAELARAVARFGDEATPVAVRRRGAPEIANLIVAINEMQARISALVKARTVFFGAVSHDLKTYITRLRLRAETIPGADQQARTVRDLDDMTSLIDDALAVARSTIVSDQREPVDVLRLIRDDVDGRPNNTIALVAEPELTSVRVSADVIALRRLFANLIDNALQFGKTCRVSVQGEGAAVVVNVDDDGPGIPLEERRAVLEPFYRLEKSRSRVTGGSGLGLAIAKEIVVAHGGSIVIEASPLGGTRVRIELPLLPQANPVYTSMAC